MKNRLLTLVVFVLILLCSSCSTKQRQIEIEAEVEVIDFFSLNKVEVDEIPASIIKEKKYIKLDASSDEFLFKRINKVIIHNDSIYILDTRIKKLIVFDKTGRGIGCVSSRGQGPGEYLQIEDFDIDSLGNVYFIDGRGSNDRLFVFDKTFQFVSVKKMPFEADIISCLPNNKLLFGLSSWNKWANASKQVAITDMELKTEQSYLQYDEYIDEAYWISSYMFINTEDHILYNKQISNYVYEISPEGQLQKAYLFDFGKKNVPNPYKKDIEGNLDKFKRFCCLKNFVVINDKYIFGTLWDDTKTKNFIVDKNDKTVYLTKKEIADADNSNFSGYCNNQIISYIYPGKYDDIQAMDFPADVKKHIEDENFVLCLYTLK
jgi:hypothetical protein